MPQYSYDAVDVKGKPIRGTIEARTPEEAKNKIHSLNQFPTSIKQVGGAPGAPAGAKAPAGGKPGEPPSANPALGAGSAAASIKGPKKKALFGSGVNSKQLTTFTQQLSTLIDAGLPIVRSLKILSDQLPPSVFKDIVTTVAEDVEGGSTLSEAMARHPKVFDKLFTNMIKAGEAGGVLDTVLRRLAEFMEKSQRIKKKLIGASVYPVCVIGIAVVILCGIMIFVIPQFEKMFKDMGKDLPMLTTVLINISHNMVFLWPLLFIVPLGLYFGYKTGRKNPAFCYAADKMKLRMPLFGMLIKKSVIARFTRTFGTLITSGVAILEALTICKGSIANTVLANAIEKVAASIREGDSIAEPLGASGLFDDIVVNMIDVGEETGELDKMLIKIADNYDEDVDVAVESLTSLLEPLMIIFMGGAVGTIVIALFMPLVKLLDGIGGK